MVHPRRRPTLRAAAALIVLVPVVGALTLATVPARAASAGTYQITMVARQCPTYQDITANLARNNIQESLQDLGADTAYMAGQPISPSVETPNQPNCTPLVNWQFQFGNGINGVTPGTNLSRVSNPQTPTLTTQSSVPLLDTSGNPTGSTIAGAVTATLTPDQVTQSLNHNLWVQGGTTTDPLGTAAFPDRYAFGALRCAIDNLNGDNVEWAGFPSGQTHVFCYYYAVALPPKPGVIQISKVLTNAGSSTPTFPFIGTVSYNPGGTFDVPAGSSVSFTRDSNVDWTFSEQPLAGYSFVSAVCTSQNGTSSFNNQVGGATFTTNVVVTVDLSPGDNASCVYTNTRNVVDLTVLKQTTGGIGSFPITVTTPSSVATDLTATTTTEGVPAEACSSDPTPVCHVVDNPGSLPATYTVAESLPSASAAGSWAVTAFDCNGVSQSPALSQSVVVTSADESLACTFTNTFTPTGSITLTKTTVGGTGTTEFAVVPTAPSGEDDVADPVYSATTTEAGVAATATQVSGDYSLDALDLGQYSIVETGPEDTAAGSWAPQSITCNGQSSDPTSSDVLVTLTTGDPHITCVFTNVLTATPPTTTTTTAVVTTTTSTVPGGVAADETGTSGGGQPLAMTGEDVRLPIGVGVALAVAGGLLLVVDRVRRRPAPVQPGRDDPPST